MKVICYFIATLAGSLLVLFVAVLAIPSPVEPTPAKHGYSYKKIGDIEDRYGVFLLEAQGEKYILVKTAYGAALCPHKPLEEE